MRWWTVAVLPFCLFGCWTLPEAKVETLQAPPVTRMWPESPEPARIQYLESIRSDADLRLQKSVARRVGEWVLGISDEKMVRPMGIAVRGDRIIVADPGTPALFFFDRETGETRKVNGLEGQPFVSPVAVSASAAGDIYVADSYLGQIFVFSPDGELLRTLSSDVLERPSSVALDEKRGRLYVADPAAHKLHAFDTAGAPLFSVGGRGTAAGKFNGPSHVALGKNGHAYVVDSLNFRIQEFDSTGRFVSMFGRHGDGSGDFARPKGVALDSEGHLYVVDALFDTVQIFREDGRLLLAFGENGEGPGQFWLPTGIAIDERDRIYVADSYNRRVQVFQYLGEAYQVGMEEPQ